MHAIMRSYQCTQQAETGSCRSPAVLVICMNVPEVNNSFRLGSSVTRAVHSVQRPGRNRTSSGLATIHLGCSGRGQPGSFGLTTECREAMIGGRNPTYRSLTNFLSAERSAQGMS
jgi:hypothetical protein